jgi:hypothetical protein
MYRRIHIGYKVSLFVLALVYAIVQISLVNSTMQVTVTEGYCSYTMSAPGVIDVLWLGFALLMATTSMYVWYWMRRDQADDMQYRLSIRYLLKIELRFVVLWSYLDLFHAITALSTIGTSAQTGFMIIGIFGTSQVD